MRFIRLVPLALLCIVVLGGLAVVAGAPPPTQLCGSCGSDIPGSTGPGTLDVHVDSSGDSQWVERVPVTADAADRYREDPEALERAVEEGWARWHVAGATDRTVALEDETVVVDYAVDDVARPGVRDAWLVDYFAFESGNDRYRLAAERVTIHTPDDTVVTNEPRHASVEGNTATWSASGDDGNGDSSPPSFDRQTAITYGSSGALGTASSYATIGLEIGPTALEQGVIGGLAPGIVIGFAGFAAGRTDWGVDAFDAAELERLLVVVGAVGAVGLLVASTAATGRPLTPGFGALSALGVGYATIGIAVRRGGYRPGTRGVTRLAALVTLGTGVLLWLLGGSTAIAALPFGLATALFLPIGYASERRSSLLVPLFLAAVAPTAAAVALSLLVSPMGLGVIVYWLLLVVWAIAVAVFGYPIALLGRRLADQE